MHRAWAPLLLAALTATTTRRAAADEPAGAAVDEVTISGVRRATSSPTEERLRSQDVRLVPGAFGDPFRAIDILPGVVPTISGLPYYFIRGAPPAAVGYFVDEVRVPYLFHFALGPSVIQPSLIEEVSLHPAAYPARYGRYAGGVIVGRTREPAEVLRGEGQVRIYDLGGFVEAPFASGRVTAGAGGRYGYTAALFSLIHPDLTLDYRDYNARVSVDLDERWRASALTFGAYDYASEMVREVNMPPYEKVFFASEFHRLDLRLDRRGSDGAESRIAATIGFDRSRIEGTRFAQDVLVGLRARHGGRAGREVDAEIGLDTTIDSYGADIPSPYAVTAQDYADASYFFGSRVDSATGAWATATWHRGGARGVEITTTARADVFTSDGVSAVAPSPRSSMRVPIVLDVAFIGALGIVAQPPAFTIPIPAVGYRRLPGGLGYGYQKSAGLESKLPLGFTARAVGFHHTYIDVRNFARASREVELDFRGAGERELEPTPRGQGFGLELHVARRLSARVGALVSYTLSRSENASFVVESRDARLPARLNTFDRTHVFQIAGSVDLGRGYRTSARFLTYRGWPDEGNDPRGFLPSGRLSPFVRFDVRFEKRWRWRESGHLALIVEGQNVTATREVLSRSCDVERCRDEKIGPIVVPSIGVEGAL